MPKTPLSKSEKLQKVLANRGIASRREIERWIVAGRISVNGEIATLGLRIDQSDVVQIDKKAVRLGGVEKPKTRILLYNKPEGEICSRKDPEQRPDVFARLPKIKGQRWISVGRLDINTAGLLLFTNDGALANKLMHPSSEVEREYLVRVRGQVSEQNLQAMKDGVEFEEGVARFTDIVKSGGNGLNSWFYVVLMQGRNREVRRLWESQGMQVSRLKRVRYGSLFIPSAVKSGQWTELSDQQIRQVQGWFDKPKTDSN